MFSDKLNISFYTANGKGCMSCGRKSEPSGASSVSETIKRRHTMLFTSSVTKEVLERLSENQIKRQHVIFEIIATESQYVNDLKLLLHMFVRPIQEQNILTKEESGSVFGNIESIIPINQDIITALNKRKKMFGPVVEKIGDIYLHRVNLFKIYAVYCSTNRHSSLQLNELKESNPELRQFIATTSKKRVMRGLSLEDLLILPLQRICKYPLLFKSLLDVTSETHRDRKDLEEVYTAMKEIVTKINDWTRKVENVKQLTIIHEKYNLRELGIDLFTKDNCYIERDDEVLVTKKHGKEPKPAASLLFHDTLLILRLKNDEYTLLCRAPLFMIDIPDNEADDLSIDLMVGRDYYSLTFTRKKQKIAWQSTFTELLEKSPVEASRDDEYFRSGTVSTRIKRRVYNSLSRRSGHSIFSSNPLIDSSSPAKSFAHRPKASSHPRVGTIFSDHDEIPMSPQMENVESKLSEVESDKEKISILKALLAKEYQKQANNNSPISRFSSPKKKRKHASSILRANSASRVGEITKKFERVSEQEKKEIAVKPKRLVLNKSPRKEKAIPSLSTSPLSSPRGKVPLVRISSPRETKSNALPIPYSQIQETKQTEAYENKIQQLQGTIERAHTRLTQKDYSGAEKELEMVLPKHVLVKRSSSNVGLKARIFESLSSSKAPVTSLPFVIDINKL